MDFDFAMLLVLLTLFTGGVWLVDAVAFAPRRKQAAGDEDEAGAGENMEEDREEGYKEPLLVEYSRSFFPVILAVLVLRSFLVEPFKIPSGSMMPTLLIGDFILVNKFTYGIRLPVLDKKIIEVGEPERGDVIVFRFPEDPSIDYIKRVVGVPGDTIGYRDKTLFINGKPAPQIPVGFYQGSGSGAAMTGALESVERIGNLEHSVLINRQAPDHSLNCQRLSRGPVTVPEGHYFAMGDNRDNSRDSRCWGFVPEQNLVGKAFGIWMSWDLNRSGFPIAWERLGEGID
jgi:signal peptidase I